MKPRRRALGLAIGAALFCLAIFFGCEQRQDQVADQDPPAPVVVATSKDISSTPLFIADRQGFFRQEGLAVRLVINNAGIDNYHDLLQREVEIAMMADFPLVKAVFGRQEDTAADRDDFVIFANLVLSTDISRILVRRDRGIDSVEDLKGKTIGWPGGTSIDFLLDLFLMTHDIDRSAITLLDLEIDSLVEAMVAGRIDAMFAWQPHIGEAMLRLGDRSALLPLNLYYHNAWLAVSRTDFARQHPDRLQRFLRALVRAERFLDRYPEQAATIHADYTATTPAISRAALKDVTFWLSLSEGLLTTMEDQARWLIRNRYVRAADVPDFLRFIDPEPLRAVKPEGLTIIQ